VGLIGEGEMGDRRGIDMATGEGKFKLSEGRVDE